MSKKLCPTCAVTKIDSHGSQCVKCYRAAQKAAKQANMAPPLTPAEQIHEDHKSAREKERQRDLSARYREALRVIAEKQTALDAVTAIGDGPLGNIKIAPKFSSSTSEGTVVTPLSDWHIEENVGAEVLGLNVYNLTIAERRAREAFQHSLRLVRLLEQDIKISHWVLPLLGDFITNNIHGEENAELNEVQPIEAITLAQSWISSGIDFLLNNTKQQFTIPCHSGNHARTTKTTHFSAENGHSLEYFMYVNLARYYAKEPRVKFVLPQGIHSYVDIYDTTIRFQHGHSIKYGGGVGGLYIPVNKAIAQWNKAKHADLDVFGHFHQLRDGGNFICNGSVIGYNGFAMSIKADFEPPRQTLFLQDKKRGRTCMWPVLFTV